MPYYGVSHWSVARDGNRPLECWHYTCVSMGLAFGVVRPCLLSDIIYLLCYFIY